MEIATLGYLDHYCTSRRECGGEESQGDPIKSVRKITLTVKGRKLMFPTLEKAIAWAERNGYEVKE